MKTWTPRAKAGAALAAALAALAAYGAYLLILAGELRALAPHGGERCAALAGPVGAEDAALDPATGKSLWTSYDRRAEARGAAVQGAIFKLDLADPGARPVALEGELPVPFHPHGLGLWSPPGGPERLFVVDHPHATVLGGRTGEGPLHAIRAFDLDGDRLTLARTYTDDALVSPNDVAPVGPDRFYVTNDHGDGSALGHALENYLRLARAHVLYWDGARFERVAEGLRYANGLALTPDGAHLVVLCTTDREVRVYRRDAPTGALTLERVLATGTGVDNPVFDADGALWIGAHPKLLTFTRYAKDPAIPSPSQALRIPATTLATGAGAGAEAIDDVLLDDGRTWSGASVAVRWQGRLAVGSVFDAGLFVCDLPTPP